MNDPAPYKWGGDGTAGDCSGRMRKIAQQKAAGMSIAEIEASFLEDMETVMERIEEHK